MDEVESLQIRTRSVVGERHSGYPESIATVPGAPRYRDRHAFESGQWPACIANDLATPKKIVADPHHERTRHIPSPGFCRFGRDPAGKLRQNQLWIIRHIPTAP